MMSVQIAFYPLWKIQIQGHRDIYYPILPTQHQITLYFKRIETFNKTQPVHCFVSFFNIWFFPQPTMAFCATEKEIF